MSHSFFANPQYKNSIVSIYSASLITVNVENNGIKNSEKFYIYIDKHNSRNLLQIRLCNVNDQANMFISTIDNELYEKFKEDQALHVTFDGFTEHLKTIMESCKRGELHLTLVHQDINYQIIKFYEKRPFKNLIHLCLPIQNAPMNMILFHINQSLQTAQHQSNMYANQLQTLQTELDLKQEQILALKKEIQTQNSNRVEHEHLAFAKNTEHINRLQLEMKHLAENKEIEIKRLNNSVKKMQEKVDQFTKDNYISNEKFMQEKRQADALREEIRQLKQHSLALKEQNDKIQNDIISHKNHERKGDHLLTEVRKQMHDLQEKIMCLEKQKNELTAEIEAEKKISYTKRNALQIATDDITKANNIIVKKSKEVVELTKKVDWRTDVALKQERVVKQLELQNANLKKQLNKITLEFRVKLEQNAEISNQLMDMRAVADEIETKYSKKISELTNKLEQITAEQNLKKITNQYLQLSDRSFN